MSARSARWPRWLLVAMLLGLLLVLSREYEARHGRGRIENHSSTTLWVVETDTGAAVAHRLPPGHRAPHALDADGVRAEAGIKDSTAAEPHQSWWKIPDLTSATVRDGADGALLISCWFCRKVGPREFGDVRYDRRESWGEPIDP